MVNAEKNLRKFNDVMGSVIDFTNFTKNYLKKDKIMKADLEGSAFKLMKGSHKNYIELKYSFKQCYLALSDQPDWMNPEGDRILHDLSMPLPLHGAPGCLITLVDFFFNKDLEYLTIKNLEKKYSTSLTKLKAERYDLEGIKQMIPQLWSTSKEIVVRRANQKEYTFKKADFPRLHLNDIKDMYLMHAQNKLHHLTGDVHIDLVTALWFFHSKNCS
nr:hypothetical protein CTI12_AA475510 [Tanacetum cinerariifolium]